MAQRTESQTFLKRVQLRLTGWQKSPCDAVLAELSRNKSWGTCWKSALEGIGEICSQQGVSPEEFCYKSAPGDVGGNCWLLGDIDHCALRELSTGKPPVLEDGPGEAVSPAGARRASTRTRKQSCPPVLVLRALYWQVHVVPADKGKAVKGPHPFS